MAEPATRQPFVHLHVHTEYSMLDGAARLKEMFAEVERHGDARVAMTDHGNMYGALRLLPGRPRTPASQPIIGIEAYVAPEHRRNNKRESGGASRTRRATTSRPAAPTRTRRSGRRNNDGLHNLFKLSSRVLRRGLAGQVAPDGQGDPGRARRAA